MIQQGDISAQEANRLFVLWYPPPKTEEEALQEEQEDTSSLHQDLHQT
ncbi:MAG TPA: hypothetical protein VKR06_15515 [Ktedonosporobacter sp.]|nr:hypothetical protein [Ktedonosporobacter sp.]